MCMYVRREREREREKMRERGGVGRGGGDIVQCDDDDQVDSVLDISSF